MQIYENIQSLIKFSSDLAFTYLSKFDEMYPYSENNLMSNEPMEKEWEIVGVESSLTAHG